MNQYTLESFVSFCDDMQITTEASAFQSIKAKIVKVFSKLIDLIENKVKKMKDSNIKVNLMKLLSRAKAGLGKSKSLNESDPEKAKELQKEAEELKEEYQNIALATGSTSDNDIFVSDLDMGEMKSWFSKNMSSNNHKGVLRLIKGKNTVVQTVYDNSTDKIVISRKITFGELSDKVEDMFDKNNGTVVITK